MKRLAASLALMTSVILNTSVFPASAQAARANDGSCTGAVNTIVVFGSNSIFSQLEQGKEVISVGRKARRAIARIWSQQENLFQVTCENEDQQIKFFTASLAIPDGSGIKKAEFIFYVDGKMAKKVNIVQGAVASIAVDNLHKHSSYAYDIKIVDGYTNASEQMVHILNWRLINRPS